MDDADNILADSEVPKPSEFLALITDAYLETTGPYAGLWMYSWVAQDPQATATAPLDLNPPVQGVYSTGDEASYGAAVHVNNQEVPVGTFVFLSYKGFNGEDLYQFDTAPTGSQEPTCWLARLTTSSSNKWKFVKLTLNSSGAYVDDGSESAGYYAHPSTIDGTETCNPSAGLRVQMWDSGVLDGSGNPQFEFLPTGYATSGQPGLVSASNQTFTGDKTFDDDVTAANFTTAGSVAATVSVAIPGADLSANYLYVQGYATLDIPPQALSFFPWISTGGSITTDPMPCLRVVSGDPDGGGPQPGGCPVLLAATGNPNVSGGTTDLWLIPGNGFGQPFSDSLNRMRLVVPGWYAVTAYDAGLGSVAVYTGVTGVLADGSGVVGGIITSIGSGGPGTSTIDGGAP